MSRNIFILYRSKSSPSAIKLHEKLKEVSDKYRFFRGKITSKRINSRVGCIVNVGNSLYSAGLNGLPIINNPKKIATSANKKLARLRFKAKGIPAPKLWLKIGSIPKYDYPVVGRTTYHMKAKGFWFCKNKSEALAAKKRGATHFIKFIDNTKEFRCHVFASCLSPKKISDYTILKTSEKRATEKANSTIIKNFDNGYNFVAPTTSSKSILPELKNTAIMAISQFGLHYGAVDIMYSEDTKKFYVLEINTTPSLTNEHSDTLNLYATQITQVLDNSL